MNLLIIGDEENAADEKLWRASTDKLGVLTLRTINDALDDSGPALVIERTGSEITSIVYGDSQLYPPPSDEGIDDWLDGYNKGEHDGISDDNGE